MLTGSLKPCLRKQITLMIFVIVPKTQISSIIVVAVHRKIDIKLALSIESNNSFETIFI